MPHEPSASTAQLPLTPSQPAVQPSRTVRPLVAMGLLAAVILLWGANWPVMKVGVQLMPPLTFAAGRLVMGAATLALVAALAGQMRRPDRADLPIVIWVGLLQMGGFLLLISLALQIVSAGRSAILAYTTPLWVVPLARIFLGERLSWAKGLGLAAGLSGIAVLFNPLAVDWSDGRVLLGNGLLLLAALTWAINIVQVRRHRWVGTPLSLGPWQLLVGALIMVPLALMMEGMPKLEFTPTLIAVLIYNGPIATGFCYWAMVTANRALPASTLSLSTLATPVVGLLLSTWMLGEPLTFTNLLGLLFIGGGLALVALGESRK